MLAARRSERLEAHEKGVRCACLAPRSPVFWSRTHLRSSMESRKKLGPPDCGGECSSARDRKPGHRGVASISPATPGLLPLPSPAKLLRFDQPTSQRSLRLSIEFGRKRSRPSRPLSSDRRERNVAKPVARRPPRGRTKCDRPLCAVSALSDTRLPPGRGLAARAKQGRISAPVEWRSRRHPRVRGR